MSVVVRLVAVVIALVCGLLAWITGTAVLASGLAWPLYAGQVRGLVFAAAMIAAVVGLLWVAIRLDGGRTR